MPKRPRLVRDRDYVITDDGQWQFTRDYLLGLGQCCKNDCLFCPYQKPMVDPQRYTPSAAVPAQSNPSPTDHRLK